MSFHANNVFNAFDNYKITFFRSLVYSVYTGRLPKSCECLRQMLSLVHLLGLDLGNS